MQLRRVVVTGLGALTPVGNSAPETWQALVNGVSGIAPITAFDATNFKTHFAGEVKNFDPTPLMDRKEARKMDRYSQFSVWVADEALKDSGLDLTKRTVAASVSSGEAVWAVCSPPNRRSSISQRGTAYRVSTPS